ncbi:MULTISPECIES: class I SAM-dependent methyltransferase [unclassified Saccharicrinis]|uniref:class I SAM-dependent methyltransferase n=1 Tax=unclassified Saccharicrinis TaxID=2646859 RepID=UPI003D3547E9
MEEQKPIGKPEKFWDIVSRRFVNSTRTMNSAALQTIKKDVNKFFKSTDIVLDFGCGPGDITLVIAQNAQKVYATDISTGMIDAAKKKASEQNISNIKFTRTNLFDGKFQSNSFDKITAFNVLQYIEDKKQLYSKIHELLKPQGLFISATACLRERKSALRFLMAGLTKLKIVPKIFLYKTSELENEMKGAGFKIIEATNIAKVPERFIIAQKD